MLKKTLLGLMIAAASATASAELTTEVQHQEFSGEAGQDSSDADILPLEFEMFDESLGILTGVYISYTLDVSGGLIGADNLTDEDTSGTGSLGVEVLFSEMSGMNFFEEGTLDDVFTKLSRIETTTFSLEADPTMSVDGSGADVQQYDGTAGTVDSDGYIALNTDYLEQFIGTDETFTVDFDTSSITSVDVTGAQGFFQPVNMILGVDLYYTYEEVSVVEETSSVPAPLSFAALGLVMTGLGARRKAA
ncbi:choice-of-anchor E domain-containing protein [Alteromonas sp. 14N.309.X.WAT.G.H12]|uniref:choice-of-anchor E domain-containing protein n=1 Tax=Alteromonas sp. 14N.309.X.WAT.G.H12 TaxID=3120824 RepID=UPI002FD02ED2